MPPTVKEGGVGPSDFDAIEFPALYVAADRNSLAAQRHFLTATQLRLVLLVIASLFGGVVWLANGTDIAGVVAAVAFAGAIGTELYLVTSRAEKVWYDGRAVAESAKTLTWRYIVRGGPFSSSVSGADERFAERLNALIHDVPGDHLVPVSDTRTQITSSMRRARDLSLDDRQSMYLHRRIRDQHAWYSSKARWNASRARRWNVSLVGVETLGLIAAILKATGVLSLNLLGLAGAMVAAGVAWLQARQHETLGRAYSIAAQELAEIASRVDQSRTDDEWGDFVDQAEEAISREHTMWRASHT